MRDHRCFGSKYANPLYGIWKLATMQRGWGSPYDRPLCHCKAVDTPKEGLMVSACKSFFCLTTTNILKDAFLQQMIHDNFYVAGCAAGELMLTLPGGSVQICIKCPSGTYGSGSNEPCISCPTSMSTNMEGCVNITSCGKAKDILSYHAP